MCVKFKMFFTGNSIIISPPSDRLSYKKGSELSDRRSPPGVEPGGLAASEFEVLCQDDWGWLRVRLSCGSLKHGSNLEAGGGEVRLCEAAGLLVGAQE